MKKIFTLLVLVVFSLGMSTPARADGDENDDDEDTPAIVYNRGFHFGISPIIFFPTSGGSAGFGIAGDARYGIHLSPVILSPGARASAYFPSGFQIYQGLGTLRLTYPIAFLAPYAMGGAGVGHVSDPSKTGPALLGGGGLTIHIGYVLGIGAEATYETILDTNFHVFSVGPTLLIAL